MSEGAELKRVVIESPFAGDIERNIKYGRACMRDSVLRGEAPIASHLLYTQEGILDDNDPQERALGIEIGLAWGKLAQLTAVYTDLGFSRGMEFGIKRAEMEGREVEYRTIGWTENEQKATLTPVQRYATLRAIMHIASEVASTNTMLRDLDIEINEKIYYGNYDIDALLQYIYEVSPAGTEERVERMIQEMIADYQKTL